MTTLETTSPSRPPPPELDGFDDDGSAWRLDLDRYGAFVAAVTGIRPTADCAAGTCYRVGNRLEAFVAEKQDAGEWTPALVEQHAAVDSLDQIYALARFFRHCHETHVPTPTA